MFHLISEPRSLKRPGMNRKAHESAGQLVLDLQMLLQSSKRWRHAIGCESKLRTSNWLSHFLGERAGGCNMGFKTWHLIATSIFEDGDFDASTKADTHRPGIL